MNTPQHIMIQILKHTSDIYPIGKYTTTTTTTTDTDTNTHTTTTTNIYYIERNLQFSGQEFQANDCRFQMPGKCSVV